MRSLVSILGRGLVALTLSLGLAAPLAPTPSHAASIVVPIAPATAGDVQTVRDHRNYQRRNWRRDRHDYRRYHRDHRRYGRHYRRHRDRDAAIALGLGLGVLGGVLATRPYYEDRYYVVPQRRVHRSYGNAHVQWCYDRYRSYRAYDNTFQPYGGGRRVCYSPYS